ncbi:MAG: hypothetical protein U0Q11_17510 [Vicinamibacterales bacterium]
MQLLLGANEQLDLLVQRLAFVVGGSTRSRLAWGHVGHCSRSHVLASATVKVVVGTAGDRRNFTVGVEANPRCRGAKRSTQWLDDLTRRTRTPEDAAAAGTVELQHEIRRPAPVALAQAVFRGTHAHSAGSFSRIAARQLNRRSFGEAAAREEQSAGFLSSCIGVRMT